MESVSRIQQVLDQLRIDNNNVILPNYLEHGTGFYILNPSVSSPLSSADLDDIQTFTSDIVITGASNYLSSNWVDNGWSPEEVEFGKQIASFIKLNTSSDSLERNIVLVRGSYSGDSYTVVLLQVGNQGIKVFNDLLVTNITDYISDPSLWVLDTTRGWWRNIAIPHTQEGSSAYFAEFLFPLDFVQSVEKVTASFHMSNSSENMLYRLFIHFMVGNTVVKSVGLRDSWDARSNGIRVISDDHSSTTITATNYVATLTGTVPPQYVGQITSIKMEASRSSEYGRTPAGIKNILFQTTFELPF